MSTNLPRPATLGPQVTSIRVHAATLRADGAVRAEFQGLDDKGAIVLQAASTFQKDAAAAFFPSATSANLLVAIEAVIVKAIADTGAPPPDAVAPAPLPVGVHHARSISAAIAAARAKAPAAK